jgi:hypothetical protein
MDLGILNNLLIWKCESFCGFGVRSKIIIEGWTENPTRDHRSW